MYFESIKNIYSKEKTLKNNDILLCDVHERDYLKMNAELY